MKKAYMIVDGQYGSCGKGLIAGYLAAIRSPDVVVCNFGPNAGHTYIDRTTGLEFVTQQLPTGVVSTSATILIGPGAIIDPRILLRELESMRDMGLAVSERLRIHPHAAVVTEQDLIQERETMNHIASTKKGVGAAIVRKISRPPVGDLPRIAADSMLLKPWVTSISRYESIVDNARLIQVESAQGFELSLNHGAYPFTTSRDITIGSIANDCAIPVHMIEETVVVMRTFPIRVGDEFKDGKKIGTSGPVYADMRELDWPTVSAIARQNLEERTTVTKKIRRVFSFSETQYRRMLREFGTCRIFLNFLNYVPEEKRRGFVEALEEVAAKNGSSITWVGLGPAHEDVYKTHVAFPRSAERPSDLGRQLAFIFGEAK